MTDAELPAPAKWERCRACGQGKPVLYLVRHHQTVAHWRCQRCMNLWLHDAQYPFLVLGIWTRSRTCHLRTTHVAAGEAARAAHRLLMREDEPEGSPEPGWLADDDTDRDITASTLAELADAVLKKTD